MTKRAFIIFFLVNIIGCAARNYTYYSIDLPPQKSAAFTNDEGPVAQPFALGTTNVMKVRWNDGKVLTEVELPVFASGQRVVIEHGTAIKEVKTIRSTKLVPPPPTRGDNTLVEAYRARGLSVNESAADISISTAKSMVQDALKSSNYQLALEWCEAVLERYPSHPDFLRTKASVLLLMGEREKAIEIYQAAEEIESDPQVRKKLQELEHMK